MSRGHGWLQRILLALIEASDRGQSTYELAVFAYQVAPTTAQLNSTRLALKKLMSEGRIAMRKRGGDHQLYWGNAAARARHEAELARIIEILRRSFAEYPPRRRRRKA